MIDVDTLSELVREIVRETLRDADTSVMPTADGALSQEAADAACDDGCKPRVVTPQRVVDAPTLARIVDDTPARIVQGRTGTRYLTKTYVGLRAEHAIALDAVHSEVPPEFAKQLGCIALHSRAQDKTEYLLHPDQGRRLDDESKKRLAAEASRGVDVQVIAGDGLAPWALLKQGPALLPALLRELQAVGLSVGKPLFVKYARIGVQDEIGVLTQAKSTIILVGERPGLGTGDSLSIYTAYAPKLGQDNAEKNCISNVRELGIPPLEAARECATLMKRTFAAGGGGLNLVRPLRVISKRASIGGAS